jgi:hypothetical protein
LNNFFFEISTDNSFRTIPINKSADYSSKPIPINKEKPYEKKIIERQPDQQWLPPPRNLSYVNQNNSFFLILLFYFRLNLD